MFKFHTNILEYYWLISKFISENLALNRYAWQSSTFKNDPHYSARKAVDGDRAQTRLYNYSCAIGAADQKSGTWRVDLDHVLSIHHIEIYYRNENDWGM